MLSICSVRVHVYPCATQSFLRELHILLQTFQGFMGSFDLSRKLCFP